MSGRQDYITKVRYKNDLPPPNCPPRLLKYSGSLKTNHESIIAPGVLSSLFRKQNFKRYINLSRESNIHDPLALSLDLIELPGIFDENDSSALHALPFSNAANGADALPAGAGSEAKIKLHDKDRALLRNPDFSLHRKDTGRTNGELKDPASVSFLRKTEYISNKSHFLGSNKKHASNAQDAAGLQEKSKINDLDPESQLANIELSFEQASETLSGAGFAKLRHPIKKHLKAVRTWSLTPNTEMMDQAYFSTKFIGSASLSRTKHRFSGSNALTDQSHNGVNANNPVFTTSVFKPITLTDEEWMSFFTLNDLNRAKQLKRKIDAVELDEEDTFKMKFNRDFDLKYDNFDSLQIKQVAVNLSNTKTSESALDLEDPSIKNKKTNLEAKYLPIQGKIELKKKRLNPEDNDAERESVHFDEINFTIRESTANEEAVRDQERSRFDPYNYVAQIDEEEDAEDEGEDEANEGNDDVGEEVNEDEY